MEIEFLTKFGMTPVEAKIYKELLLLKESQIGPIIDRTKIHRGTVYNSLKKLIEKGFVSFIRKNGAGYYIINNIKVFHKKIEDEKKRLQDMDAKIKEIKEISQLNELLEKPNIEVLTGDEGFKLFFKDLYDYSYRTKKEYFFMGRGNEMLEHFGEEYYRHTQELKKNLKLNCRVILSDVARNEPVKKIVVGNVRHLSWKYPSHTSTWIYGNKVNIVLWKTNPIKILVINSKEVRNSYASFFEEMWNLAKP